MYKYVITLFPPLKGTLNVRIPTSNALKDFYLGVRDRKENKRRGANSGRYWETGRPGMLLSTRSQTVRHDLKTEQ